MNTRRALNRSNGSISEDSSRFSIEYGEEMREERVGRRERGSGQLTFADEREGGI
jgi:hypothetical protein